jgi:hypothetical protein
MKKLALSALVAALALAACDNTPNDDVAATEAGAAATDTTVVVPGPTATETTVVTTPGATATATTDGDKVSVGPNGVTADVGDGDTRVRVDTNNPNLTVEKK